MKTVILCGGFGTRLSEETQFKPKPMVEIGDMPILWHIMKIYEQYGHNEFYLPLGYKGEIIKDYFLNYHLYTREVIVKLRTGEAQFKDGQVEDWTIHMIDTGLNSMTGGRLLRLHKWLSTGTFMLTYGDGVSNVNIDALLDFHKSHGKIATVTAVRPTARFGGMQFEGDRVSSFQEKPQTGEGWINGGFFVFNPEIFDYLTDQDDTVLEQSPLSKLALEEQLMAYKHDGFWQCMDTLRDKKYLISLWENNQAPWKWWDDK